MIYKYIFYFTLNRRFKLGCKSQIKTYGP